MLAMQPIERLRQPHCGGALHRAKAQRAARTRARHRVARFLGQRQQPIGVVEQYAAFRRELHPPPFADEQGDAEILLELLDARRHVRLHAVQLLRGARDAAGAHDGAERPLRSESSIVAPPLHLK